MVMGIPLREGRLIWVVVYPNMSHIKAYADYGSKALAPLSVL